VLLQVLFNACSVGAIAIIVGATIDAVVAVATGTIAGGVAVAERCLCSVGATVSASTGAVYCQFFWCYCMLLLLLL
jgi:hypothetical protein